MCGKTISELIKQGTEILKSACDTDAPRTARLILGQVLSFTETQLIAHSDENVSGYSEERYLDLISRRAAGEPLQYILGEWEFYGRKFITNPGAFIPRPETEFIIDAIKSRVDNNRLLNILEIGTGSGAISVTLAAELPKIRIIATDVNPASSELAKQNAALNGVEDRISFLTGDGLDVFRKKTYFDIVVTNPPYVPDAAFERLQREIIEYEPRVAFVGGPDGLDFIRRIILPGFSGNSDHPIVSDILKPEGLFVSEIGWSQRQGFSDIIENSDSMVLEEVIEDYNGIPRTMVCSRKY
ncbi:MAG: peptide chain release factor N(5)-glutamine methyltransferase [Acidobacteria bacterium]|nr:peptide chain release factor N(5)-glutamine methyltransferase [Acidobacteriota bacterium]